MLDEILAATRNRIQGLDSVELHDRAVEAGPGRPFAQALAAPGLAVIAEVKRRSPSRGDLAPALDPVGRVQAYAAGGAAAVSVLTNAEFFGGSLADLEAVRGEVGLPVLRKDFILDSRQIWESRAAGADAVLLIVAALSDESLAELLTVGAEAGLEALVEVHDESEAERALTAGALMVGVNNRDLATFEVDLAVAERLAPMVVGRAVTVAESGIGRADHAVKMAVAGYDAILVGEALVRAEDPAGLVAELRGVSA